MTLYIFVKWHGVSVWAEFFHSESLTQIYKVSQKHNNSSPKEAFLDHCILVKQPCETKYFFPFSKEYSINDWLNG